MSATTTQLLSSSEFYKLRNVSFYTNNSKMPNFGLSHTCRKWAISTFGGERTACTFTAHGGNVFLWYLPYYTMSYPRGPQYKYTLLWKLKDHMSA